MDAERLAALRTEYARAGLSEADAGDDPVAMVDRWLEEAVVSGMHEPNAMALATATSDGAPSVRIVLLKGLDARGAVFYTHGTSRKGRELEVNPRAAATLLWHPLQRQVRIEGPVERVDPAESDAYFASRPRGSQIGAAASDQSAPISDREALERRVAEVEAAAGDGPVARPQAWGGYRIVPDVIELWQGRENRLHDRLLFERAGAAWRRTRLQP